MSLMRQNQNPRRSRGRINNGRNQGGKPAQDNNQQNRRGFTSSRQFESQGPDGKNRGTASQLFERYTQLAREVMSADRTLAEAFSQFADHYYRMAVEAGYDAEAGRNREVAPATGESRPEVTENAPSRDRADGHYNNGNSGVNGNVASPTTLSDAEEGEFIQSTAPQPSVDGGMRDGSDPHRGNSRRRRAQNYRDARGAAEETSSRPAPVVSDVVVAAPVVSAPVASDDQPAVVTEVKPRRRLVRPAPAEDKTATAENAPAVQPQSVAVEVVKPRRGRPRKVVLSDEPAA